MLVLSRKQGEGIRIGGSVVVRIVRTGKGSVRIGVEAPAEIEIARDELPLVVPVVGDAVVELEELDRAEL